MTRLNSEWNSVRGGKRLDHAQLLALADGYLAALLAGKPYDLAWDRRALFTENGVPLALGDGAWATVDSLEPYYLRFADAEMQSVGFFRVVRERGNPALYSARLTLEDGLIAEAETIVARRRGEEPFPNPDPLLLRPEPVFDEVLDAADRRPRLRLIAIADAYFSTLELNDGQLFVEFDPRCNRRENGNQTTNNPALSQFGAEIGMPCVEAFRLGVFRFDDELRDRRYHLVDEQRGLVFASAFIDHSARVDRYHLTDGTERRSMFKTPNSLCMLELFKIVGGRIRQIEAAFVEVPYRTRSPWSGR